MGWDHVRSHPKQGQGRVVLGGETVTNPSAAEAAVIQQRILLAESMILGSTAVHEVQSK